MKLETNVATIEDRPVPQSRPAHPPDASRRAPMLTKAPGRVIQLDFVRGIAILVVMAYHFHTVPVHNPVARVFDFVGKRIGWIGVDLFFVLSGFLVG